VSDHPLDREGRSLCVRGAQVYSYYVPSYGTTSCQKVPSGRIERPLGGIMSDTLSVDVVGPSYWTYVATVLAECLERVAKTGRVQPDLVPKPVYKDVKEFFRLVLQSVGDEVPDDPPASLNAYAIAAEAIRRSSMQSPATREALGARLSEYARLVNRLSKPGELKENELEAVKSLQGFFVRLAQEGEAEVYETTFDLEPPFVAFSLAFHR
jgi:hypothetical protein